MNISSSCGAGALGAVVGNLAANLMLTSNQKDPTTLIAFGQMMAGIAGAIAGGKAEDIDIAAQAGANVVANNELLHLGSPIEALTRSGYTLLRVSLPGGGVAYVDPRMATALDSWIGLAAAEGVSIDFKSIFRESDQPVRGAVYPPAGNDSLHNAGLAIDIRYEKLEDVQGGLTAAEQRAILRKTATQAGLAWGGNFSKPDVVHFFIDPYGKPNAGRASLIKTQQDAFKYLNRGK